MLALTDRELTVVRAVATVQRLVLSFPFRPALAQMEGSPVPAMAGGFSLSCLVAPIPFVAAVLFHVRTAATNCLPPRG